MSCPICKAPTQAAYRPFCSKRCADLDLANWLTGRYALPSQQPESIENEQEPSDLLPPRPH